MVPVAKFNSNLLFNLTNYSKLNGSKAISVLENLSKFLYAYLPEHKTYYSEHLVD